MVYTDDNCNQRKDNSLWQIKNKVTGLDDTKS